MKGELKKSMVRQVVPILPSRQGRAGRRSHQVAKAINRSAKQSLALADTGGAFLWAGRMAGMRIALGFIAALLVYGSCYCTLLKGGRYVTYDGNGMLSRAKPVYRFTGTGEAYPLFESSVEAIFSPINEMDRLLRPEAWPGPQRKQTCSVMRYSLRTLLIVMTIGPVVLAVLSANFLALPLRESDKVEAARQLVAWIVEEQTVPGFDEEYPDAKHVRNKTLFLLCCDFLPLDARLSTDPRVQRVTRTEFDSSQGFDGKDYILIELEADSKWLLVLDFSNHFGFIGRTQVPI